MSSVTHQLVARSLEHLSNRPEVLEHPDAKKLTYGLAVVVGLTSFLFFMGLVAIHYTYGQVVATLTTVETPTATAIVKTSPEDPDDPLIDAVDDKAKLEQELLIVKVKPITAKFRTTIRHLRQRAGWASRLRGLHIALIYAFAYQVLSYVAASVFSRSLLVGCLSHIGISVLLSRLMMGWTHVVISEPRPERWYRRLVDRSTARKIMLPAAVLAVAEQATVLLPLLLINPVYLSRRLEYRIYNGKPMNGHDDAVLGGLGVGALALFLVASFLINFPAQVMFTRVQASLLREEEEPIVPFDRTFGGKVVPAVTGGSGVLGMRDAWTTFDWNARVRLVKVYLKVFAMQTALFFACFGVILLELYAFVGPDYVKRVLSSGRP